MKELSAPKIDLSHTTLDYYSLAQKLKAMEWHQIDQAPWKEQYPYQPIAKFQIAYDDRSIVLHYDIEEEFVKGQYIRPNENIWEDSCVEFFVSFDGKETYYNLEFNVLGTGLIGYGTMDRKSRQRLSEEQILSVNCFSQVQTIQGKKSWCLILIVPLSIFGISVSDLEKHTVAANFYKCGDSLPNPHFLAWNKIDNPNPNFHLPAFFGEIHF